MHASGVRLPAPSLGAFGCSAAVAVADEQRLARLTGGCWPTEKTAVQAPCKAGLCATYTVMLSAPIFVRRRLIVAGAAVALLGGGRAAWRAVGPLHHKWLGDDVRFSRDIRPIFNQNCVPCHGGVRQKNGVSFIFREDALGVGKSGRRTIVPGKPDSSELIARITSTDPEMRMPYHAPPLPPQQVALLRQWIKEGAKWEDHWAFVAPKPQPLPAVNRLDGVRQPLDRFILTRLEKEGLAPSPEADQ